MFDIHFDHYKEQKHLKAFSKSSVITDFRMEAGYSEKLR